MKINILLVDDIPANLLALESLLEQPAINIIKAYSGSEALSYLLEHEFALILLDVQMPNMDGLEFAELVRGTKKTKNIPIIFITANDQDTKTIHRAYSIGAVDFLFKPIDEIVLKNKVQVFLDLYAQRKTLEHLSSFDGLTGITNRRYFDEHLRIEWKRAYDDSALLGLLIIDIDFFKLYNDNYGHLAGDDCLKKVANSIANSLKRSTDFVSRYGGEEFAVVIPGANFSSSLKIAEKIRSDVESMEILHELTEVNDYVTVSLGASSIMPLKDSSPEELIKKADKALYRAKENGRNRSAYL
jgi:diguanylate cyclase (GGDEF)-like protein